MRWSPTQPRTLLLTALLLTAALSLASTKAHAQDTPNAPTSLEELQQAAAEAYGAGDYKKAISFMTRAYGLNPHPNYLLNIAVAYSKIGDCENARLWAQNAIDAREPALPEEAITTARSVQTDCEALESKENKENKDNNAVQNPSPPPDTAKVTPPEPIAWTSIAAYSLLGGGGVISLASIFLDLKIGKDIDDLQASDITPEDFKTLRDDIDAQQPLVTTGYVVGGLLIAAGGTLLVLDLLDEPTPANPTSARLTPWLEPHGGGLLLHAGF